VRRRVRRVQKGRGLCRGACRDLIASRAIVGTGSGGGTVVDRGTTRRMDLPSISPVTQAEGSSPRGPCSPALTHPRYASYVGRHAPKAVILKAPLCLPASQIA